MPREREAYRDNLERILASFPGRETLTVQEVARYLRKDPRTVKRIFPFKPGLGISVATMARYMS